MSTIDRLGAIALILLGAMHMMLTAVVNGLQRIVALDPSPVLGVALIGVLALCVVVAGYYSYTLSRDIWRATSAK